VTGQPRLIAAGFPQPSARIETALDELQLATDKPPETAEELRQVASLARPWDPPSCPPDLRHQLWCWLDTVAGWINEEYTWRTEPSIPICWPQHPHIVHELAVIACLRHTATYKSCPDVLEEWHRYTLPMFLNRIEARLGRNGCPPNNHSEPPAVPRLNVYRSDKERETRRAYFAADVAESNRHSAK